MIFLTLTQNCYDIYQNIYRFCITCLLQKCKQQKVDDIRNYIVQEEDRMLITYGNDDKEAIDKQLAELNAQTINRL